MAEILRPNFVDPLDINGEMRMPAMEVPSFRLHVAKEKNVEKKLLFATGGGLGDYICVEPVFRYAFNTFKDCEISLVSNFPELFRHLPFKKVYHEKTEKPIYENYLTLRPMPDHEGLQCEFVTHLWSHCIDYQSVNMFRGQIPNEDKEINLFPDETEMYGASYINPETDIVLHPGRSWQSRTFPVEWWNGIIAEILAKGFHPVLIGSNSAMQDRGTLDVNSSHCLDLRDKLPIMNTVAVLQKARVVITNDSAPLHMAASGRAWIGVISTARHPYYITHVRNKTWGWREENLSLGGVWQTYDLSPGTLKTINISECCPDKLLSWLPDPKSVAQWGIEKLGLH